MSFADDGVGFPITETAFFLNDRWTLINADAVFDLSPPVV